MYRFVDLRKALIEIDNLVTGLKNRLVLTVQRVVRGQDRQSIHNMKPIIAEVRDELRVVEEEWGVLFHEFGFSTFSPTPETLEITQLRNLAEEKLALYHRFRAESGLSEDAAVALISGAVITMRGDSVFMPPAAPVEAPPPPLNPDEQLFAEPTEGEAKA